MHFTNLLLKKCHKRRREKNWENCTKNLWNIWQSILDNREVILKKFWNLLDKSFAELGTRGIVKAYKYFQKTWYVGMSKITT